MNGPGGFWPGHGALLCAADIIGRGREVAEYPGGFRMAAPQLAVNDSGVEISPAGRWHLRYRDKDHAMMLERDALIVETGVFGSIVYIGLPMRWDPPYRHERVDAETAARIKTHIFEAFEALGDPLEVHEYKR